MNNILDYNRFFQSSFDPDEKGTVLSVSHDFLGNSYYLFGLFHVIFAMMSIMFTKHSRFADLQKKLEVVKRKNRSFLPFCFSNEYEQFCPDS
jgi:hypothetical protein